MRLALNKHYVDCANSAARGLLWILFGGCVLAATLYDVGGWIVW